jgi:hypothetical protein
VDAKARRWVDSQGTLRIGKAPFSPGVEELHTKIRKFCKEFYTLSPSGLLKYDMGVFQDDKDVVILECNITHYLEDWEFQSLIERKEHLVGMFHMLKLWNEPFKYKIRYQVYKTVSRYLLGEIGYNTEPHLRGYGVDTPIIYSTFDDWSLIWVKKQNKVEEKVGESGSKLRIVHKDCADLIITIPIKEEKRYFQASRFIDDRGQKINEKRWRIFTMDIDHPHLREYLGRYGRVKFFVCGSGDLCAVVGPPIKYYE